MIPNSLDTERARKVTLMCFCCWHCAVSGMFEKIKDFKTYNRPRHRTAVGFATIAKTKLFNQF